MFREVVLGPMFREATLDPMFREVGVDTTTDLVVGLPEADVLIHIIMILIHREDKIMTVGIPFQIGRRWL